MTAREQLRQQVDGLTEDEAREALTVLASHRLVALHRDAPVDDEPDDDAGELATAREEVRRAETVSLADARRELSGA